MVRMLTSDILHPWPLCRMLAQVYAGVLSRLFLLTDVAPMARQMDLNGLEKIARILKNNKKHSWLNVSSSIHGWI